MSINYSDQVDRTTGLILTRQYACDSVADLQSHPAQVGDSCFIKKTKRMYVCVDPGKWERVLTVPVIS